jgi:hypothetical protein
MCDACSLPGGGEQRDVSGSALALLQHLQDSEQAQRKVTLNQLVDFWRSNKCADSKAARALDRSVGQGAAVGRTCRAWLAVRQGWPPVGLRGGLGASQSLSRPHSCQLPARL